MSKLDPVDLGWKWNDVWVIRRHDLCDGTTFKVSKAKMPKVVFQILMFGPKSDFGTCKCEIDVQEACLIKILIKHMVCDVVMLLLVTFQVSKWKLEKLSSTEANLTVVLRQKSNVLQQIKWNSEERDAL